MLKFSDVRRELWFEDRLLLDPWTWSWADPGRASDPEARPIEPAEALRLLHAERLCRLVPVGIIGPRDPSPEERTTAGRVGRAVGSLGVPVLCGGKTGVMEAAAEGARAAGALTIGIVPDNDWDRANRFIDLPLATGLGPARNVLVARMSIALVAVGGQYGTITEVAYGLHFGKPVFGLSGAPEIDGVRRMADVDSVVAALEPILLRLPARDRPGMS